MLVKIIVAVLWYILLTKTEVLNEEIFDKNLHNPIVRHSLKGRRNDSLSMTNSTKLICFYTFTHDFKPEVMTDLCTHIIVGFLRIDNNNHSLVISDENLQLFSDVLLLKKRNRNLKVLISVGGAGSQGFSSMVSNHTTRKMFIKSTREFLKKSKADGLDLDWEWPVLSGRPKEKVKFVQLLHEIREEFNRHKKQYILSVDVPSMRAIIELGYYVNYIAEHVDFVNVMCYDYHYYTKLYPLTGHNAPLYSSEKDNVTIFSTFNVNYSIHYWISKSMPREKIVVGLPTYGHTFSLAVPRKVALKAPATGYGSIGQNGFAGYFEICNFTKQENVTVVFDNVSKVPYAYKFPEWISFDNELSLAIKAHYILDEGLGGAMVFSVNADDYLGSCNQNGMKLPLIRKIRSILFNQV